MEIEKLKLIHKYKFAFNEWIDKNSLYLHSFIKLQFSVNLLEKFFDSRIIQIKSWFEQRISSPSIPNSIIKNAIIKAKLKLTSIQLWKYYMENKP